MKGKTSKDDGRFTDHPHVTAEEVRPVKDKDGKELSASDPGYMEALAKDRGFTYAKRPSQ